MRYILAVVTFIIATLCLGYSAAFALEVTQAISDNGCQAVFGGADEGWWCDVAIVLSIPGASFVVGIGLFVAALLVLNTKPHRQH